MATFVVNNTPTGSNSALVKGCIILWTMLYLIFLDEDKTIDGHVYSEDKVHVTHVYQENKITPGHTPRHSPSLPRQMEVQIINKNHCNSYRHSVVQL